MGSGLREPDGVADIHVPENVPVFVGTALKLPALELTVTVSGVHLPTGDVPFVVLVVERSSELEEVVSVTFAVVDGALVVVFLAEVDVVLVVERSSELEVVLSVTPYTRQR